MQQVQLETLLRLLNLALPEINEELAMMDKNGGWIILPEEIIDSLIKWKFRWWELYENEELLKAIGSTIFLDNQEALKLFRNTPIDDIYHEYGDFFESVDDIPIPEENEQNEFLEKLKNASEPEQVELLKPFCKFVMGLISVSLNYLSLMVHGRTICQLVNDAKNGDDNAYRCAVQIDRSVLRLDYFQDHLLRAQFTGDQDFLNKLSYRLKDPILRTKIRYKTLLLTFAILDDEGFLSKLPHDELLDICEEVGVYGKAYGVEDVGHLRKRLNDYKKLQKNSKSF